MQGPQVQSLVRETDPACHKILRTSMKILQAAMKVPCAAAKTQHSQMNKYIKILKSNKL